jgi:5,6,7,8-tetrahydromethanopterin hydro-lyase
MSASTMLVGEGFAGSGAHVAHVNVVLGGRDGPVATAWATALATPRAGHIPFVCVARPGVPVEPPTLFVNKAPLAGPLHEQLTWGAAQAGVAGGVADWLRAAGWTLARAATHLVIAAVWVDPAATDAELVYAGNRAATAAALAATQPTQQTFAAFISAAADPGNPYFRPR